MSRRKPRKSFFTELEEIKVSHYKLRGGSTHNVLESQSASKALQPQSRRPGPSSSSTTANTPSLPAPIASPCGHPAVGPYEDIEKFIFGGTPVDDIVILDDSPTKPNSRHNEKVVVVGAENRGETITDEQPQPCSSRNLGSTRMLSTSFSNSFSDLFAEVELRRNQNLDVGNDSSKRGLSMLSNQFRKRISEEDVVVDTVVTGSRSEVSHASKSLNKKPTRHMPTATTSFPITPTVGGGEVETSFNLRQLFQTPEKYNNIPEFCGNIGDEELCELELSIEAEDSPNRTKIGKKKARRRFKHFSSRFKSVREPSEPPPISQYNSEALSVEISQFMSSQSTESPSSSIKTPIAVWMKKDQAEKKSSDVEIRQIESPNNKHKSGASSRKSSRAEKVDGKSLLEAFKTIKSRYDDSVQLFGHDHRSGKYDEDTALHLIIRKVVDRQDKLIKTVSHDLKESKDRWIIFKPTVDPYEIVAGACLKLYKPWQELSIPGIMEPIIICANFYKTIRRTDFDISESREKEILELPIPILNLIPLSKPPFMDLLPYNLTNKNTVLKQVYKFQESLNVDVVVLSVWKDVCPVLSLLQDSDGFVSLLQVPLRAADFISVLTPGRHFRLSNVGIRSKISTFEKMALFEVMCLYGASQTYYYNLQWGTDSRWKLETFLDIPMIIPHQQSVSILEIESTSLTQIEKAERIGIEVAKAKPIREYRVSLTCCIREKKRTHLIVADDTGRRLKIEFVFDSVKLTRELPCLASDVVFTFLRVVSGKVIWDQFTICEDVDEVMEFD